MNFLEVEELKPRQMVVQTTAPKAIHGKTLKSLSNCELLEGVRALRVTERKLDREIVEYISEIETRRLFAEIGYPSVLEWLIKDLGYSESSAYRRVMAARAIRAVPEVASKIEDGRLNLVSLAKVQSAIRSEEKRTGERISTETRAMMIEKTENKTLRETEKLVAAQFPDAVKFRGVQLSLTEEQLKDLERVRELKSHSHFGASMGDIVSVLVKDYLDRHDPLRRTVKPRKVKSNLQKPRALDESFAHRSISAKSRNPTQRNTTAVAQSIGDDSTADEGKLATVERRPAADKRRSPFDKQNRKNRVPLSPSTRNFIQRRAEGGCEFQGRDGHRCGSSYQTEIDHIVPVALGGTNRLSNLRLLCRTHNSVMAERILGRSKMNQFR